MRSFGSSSLAQLKFVENIYIMDRNFISADADGNYWVSNNSTNESTNYPKRCITLQDADRYVIPMISVQPNRICCYNSYYGFAKKNQYKFESSGANLQDGIVSKHAEKRLKKYVNWLIFLAKNKRVYIEDLKTHVNFKINFITLTLPSQQIHSDKEIKERCLNQFLIELTKRWKCKLYLWKAEAQANGNVHFHITCDKYIYYADLRNCWNRIINKLGYVDRYTAEMSKLSADSYIKKYSKDGNKKKLLKRYENGNRVSWSEPNSTDVHSVHQIRNLAGYLSKYFCDNDKQEGRRKIDGNLWYCSQLLSKFNAVQIEDVGCIAEEMSKIWKKFEKNIFSKDFINLIKIPIWAIKKYIKNSKIYEEFVLYVENLLNETQLSII